MIHNSLTGLSLTRSFQVRVKTTCFPSGETFGLATLSISKSRSIVSFVGSFASSSSFSLSSEIATARNESSSEASGASMGFLLRPAASRDAFGRRMMRRGARGRHVYALQESEILGDVRANATAQPVVTLRRGHRITKGSVSRMNGGASRAPPLPCPRRLRLRELDRHTLPASRSQQLELRRSPYPRRGQLLVQVVHAAHRTPVDPDQHVAFSQFRARRRAVRL